jgi:hypothetical protein
VSLEEPQVNPSFGLSSLHGIHAKKWLTIHSLIYYNESTPYLPGISCWLYAQQQAVCVQVTAKIKETLDLRDTTYIESRCFQTGVVPELIK